MDPNKADESIHQAVILNKSVGWAGGCQEQVNMRNTASSVSWALSRTKQRPLLTSCLQACACVTASVAPSPGHHKPYLSVPSPPQECPCPVSVVTATLPFFFTVPAQVLLNHLVDVVWTAESPSMACSSDGMHSHMIPCENASWFPFPEF